MSSQSIWSTERGHGMPVVMIHGYTVDHRVLLPLEAAFSGEASLRRIYVDLPGHGNSPRLPGVTTASALADAVIDWIENTIGSEPFVVVGQSFGGQIARAVTARLGVQVLGMALLVPVVTWGEDRILPAMTTVGRDEALLAQLPASERELFAAVMTRLDQPGWELFTTHILPGWEAHDRDAAAELEAEFLLPRLPEATAAPHDGQHLLITTRNDALVGWHDQLSLLEHYPHMSTAILTDVGHSPQVESSAVVCDLIGHWLDRLELQG
ncbi:alpha/beta fold hydrolase [Microbacterium sp. ZW T5_56]|uniref:alpha/beta fold hydrolase n=1 Tax=Microbacterium sp. ZW T5_56 TaxID=3378081 RepID=UPI003853EFE4